jgi:hypothetical protein
VFLIEATLGPSTNADFVEPACGVLWRAPLPYEKGLKLDPKGATGDYIRIAIPQHAQRATLDDGENAATTDHWGA